MVDLRPDQLATVLAILSAKVPECEVWAFGSRAKWTAKDSSDLDIALVSAERIPMSVLGRLRQAFADSYLPMSVDVVDLHRVSDEFRQIIERQKVVLQKPSAAATGNNDRAKWQTLPLEQCLETLIDYRGKTPTKVSSGIPLITAKVVKNGRIETPDEFIAEEDYEGWMRRGFPQAGDVLLTMEAPLGEVAQLDNRKVALAQRLVALRGKQGLLDNWYLKYLLQSDLVQDQLRARATGTTVLGIKQSELRKINLTLPPLDEQRAMAQVLGSLDEKIELNRRMNETLEALAQSLFKSWFVDATQSALPKGWRETTIGELCEFAYGKALKAETRRTGSIPVYGSNGQVGWHDEALVKGPGIIVGRKGNPGIVIWSPTDFFPIDTTFYVVPKGECRSFYFLFHSLRSHNLASLGADSAVPGLNRNMAYMSKQVLPPTDVQEAFDKQAGPLFERVHHNNEESRTLAALRDALLPKLLSGELRVPTKNL